MVQKPAGKCCARGPSALSLKQTNDILRDVALKGKAILWILQNTNYGIIEKNVKKATKNKTELPKLPEGENDIPHIKRLAISMGVEPDHMFVSIDQSFEEIEETNELIRKQIKEFDDNE